MVVINHLSPLRSSVPFPHPTPLLAGTTPLSPAARHSRRSCSDEITPAGPDGEKAIKLKMNVEYANHAVNVLRTLWR